MSTNPNLVFIATQEQAELAAKIAERYGWERDAEYFKGKYLANLFAGYQSQDETREMIAEIASAVR